MFNKQQNTLKHADYIVAGWLNFHHNTTNNIIRLDRTSRCCRRWRWLHRDCERKSSLNVTWVHISLSRIMTVPSPPPSLLSPKNQRQWNRIEDRELQNYFILVNKKNTASNTQYFSFILCFNFTKKTGSGKFDCEKFNANYARSDNNQTQSIELYIRTYVHASKNKKTSM